MSTWQSFFGWPAGGVWSNLIASVMWGAPAFVMHHVLIRRHHERTVRDESARQTEQLKDHIDARLDQQQGGAP